jgi:hypothetical protein
MEYLIRKAQQRPGLDGDWDGPAWQVAETAVVENFLPKSSNHHPHTQARVLYDEAGLYVIFRVDDRYVRCLATGLQQRVCDDSCVEFFVEPKPRLGYFNFEMNCGGALLTHHITYEPSPESGDKTFTFVDMEWMKKVKRYHSMREVIEPEITDPVTWIVEFHVLFAFFEAHVGTLPPLPENPWRGNFQKIAMETSHPHWGAWSPIGGNSTFHQPEFFGTLRFEG